MAQTLQTSNPPDAQATTQPGFVFISLMNNCGCLTPVFPEPDFA